MTTPSPDTRRSMQRRDSSRSNSQRRPRLLRACATEPSITTSNASRGVLASPQSARRATDLLSQVAYSSSPDSLYRGSSPPSSQSPIYDRMEREAILGSSPTRHGEVLDEVHEVRPHPCPYCPFHAGGRGEPAADLTPSTDSGRYYSFPSFDTWDADQQEKEEGGTKSP